MHWKYVPKPPPKKTSLSNRIKTISGEIDNHWWLNWGSKLSAILLSVHLPQDGTNGAFLSVQVYSHVKLPIQKKLKVSIKEKKTLFPIVFQSECSKITKRNLINCHNIFFLFLPSSPLLNWFIIIPCNTTSSYKCWLLIFDKKKKHFIPFLSSPAESRSRAVHSASDCSFTVLCMKDLFLATKKSVCRHWFPKLLK